MARHHHASPVTAGLRQHGDAISHAYRYLFQTPFTSLLTILSIAIALALPGSVFSILNSLSGISEQWKDGREISVFLDTRSSDAQISQLNTRLKKLSGVASTRVITSAEAVQELEKQSSTDGLLDLLGNHALPAVIVVTPDETLSSVEAFEQLGKTIGEKKHVEDVVLDQDWVAKMLGTVAALKRFAWLVSLLFGLVVVLTISAAMRHAVLQKRAEIEVTKLVGGSDPYILRPFIYRAAILGFLSGILAVALVKIALVSLQAPLTQLTGLYARPLTTDMSVDTVLTVVALGTFIAIISAWITVQMELNKIEPR